MTESNAVKLNFYPQMVPTRNKEWGWNLQNPFVIFTSSSNEEWNNSNHPSATTQALTDEEERDKEDEEETEKPKEEKLFNQFFIKLLFNSPELFENLEESGEEGGEAQSVKEVNNVNESKDFFDEENQNCFYFQNELYRQLDSEETDSDD